MTNTRSRSLLKLFGLAILAIVVSSGLASAEDFVGTFTLPVETHWGPATLAPGSYSLRVDTGNPGFVMVRRGNKGVALILNAVIDRQAKITGQNELVAVRVGQTLCIRTLRLPEMKLSVGFYTRKAQARLLAEKRPRFLERIPITINGK